MAHRSKIGNPMVLDQRVPSSNLKYQGVTARIDSGANMRKLMQQYEGSSGPNARVKVSDEYFQRIRPTTLGAILAALTQQDESVYELAEGDARSVAASVRSVGAPSVVHSEAASPSAPADRPGSLLLLDVRPVEAFEKWHIRGAVSYPPAQLSHSTNNLPKDIYYFKGERDSSKMVVLYDDDGLSATRAGNHLVQQGVDNTYVINGGLKEFAPRFPRMLEGDVSPLPPPSTPGPSSLAALARREASSGRPPGTAASTRSDRTMNTQMSGLSSRAGGSKVAFAWK